MKGHHYYHTPEKTQARDAHASRAPSNSFFDTNIYKLQVINKYSARTISTTVAATTTTMKDVESWAFGFFSHRTNIYFQINTVGHHQP